MQIARCFTYHTVEFINYISDIDSIKEYTTRICSTTEALGNVQLSTLGSLEERVQKFAKKLNDVTTPTCSASRY